jgi:NAD(P)-dependent dehydrogenase (short-subunit alcohol dehydrogenase family)
MHDPIDRLDGRVAVIAGGTGAIGLATAQRLAARGCTCVLLHRRDDAEARSHVASLPPVQGAGHSALRADIVDSASLRTAAAVVRERWKRCDILVNSAGFTKPIPAVDLEALDDDLIDRMMQANFRGVFATIRAFAPLLKETGEALVANVSSIAAFTGNGSNLAYVGAKAALDAVGDGLARVLAPDIRVVSVSPGVVESAFVSGRGAEFNAKTAASTPLRRVGQPDDVAAAIEALATTMRFVTGTRLVIDGGRHL